MAKVNLQLNDKDTFGTYMPSVNIDRIEITPAPDTESGGSVSAISTYFTLYCTYPSDLPDASAAEWIRKELGDLRVYFVHCPYTGMNRMIRRNKLLLQDVWRAQYWSFDDVAYYNPKALESYEKTRVPPQLQITEGEEYDWYAVRQPDVLSDAWLDDEEGLGYAGRWRPFIYSFKLEYMVNEAEEWESTFIYDEKGNKTLKFGVTWSMSRTMTDWYLDKMSDYMVYAFCGSFSNLGVDKEFTEDAVMNESPHAFQKRFGDITWLEVLSYNSVPQTTKKGFIYAATEQVYAGIPMQALNGTYRDTTNATHEELRNKVSDLLASFEGLLDKSPSLKENYNSVAEIMASNDQSTDILRQLNRYRKIFTSKTATTLSGKFYLGFQSLIASFNNLLLNQEEVRPILYLNTRVIDMRKDSVGVSYIPPTADPAEHELFGDDYVPSKWITYSRMTRDVVPTHGALGDFTEFLLEEGFGTMFYDVPSPDSSGYLWESLDTFYSSEFGSFAPVGTIPAHVGEYLGLDYTSARRLYTEDWDEKGVWDSGAEGRAAQDNPSRDIVVKNQGFVHFDWEKALWTKSKVASVLHLKRLKKYFGLECPYAFFPVQYTRLIRTEPLLVTQLLDIETDGSQSFWDPTDLPAGISHISTDQEDNDSLMSRGWSGDKRIRMTLTNWMQKDFSDETGIVSTTEYVTPATQYVQHQITPPIDAGEITADTKIFTADAYDDIYSQPLNWKKYGYPWVGVSSLVPNLISNDDALTEATAEEVRTYILDAMVMNYSSYGGGSALWRMGAAWAADGGSDRLYGMYGTHDGHGSRPDLFGVYYGDEAITREIMKELNVKAFTGIPSVEQLDDDIKYSYLKFKNFDVMNPDPAQTLEGFSLTDKFQHGYRLMTFEFIDYMDDDVAYRNTTGFDYTDADWRTGSPSTYTFSAKVKDRSLLLYDHFYSLVKKEYDLFMQYYHYCFDKCSYNTEDLAFEEWFKEAALERWPEEADQPWLRAVYVFNALRMVLFGETAFDPGGDESRALEEMRINNLMWISKISPYTGRLVYLQHFRFWFANTLNMLYPQADLPQTVEALFSEEFDEMREVIEAVDLTLPEESRRVIYDDAGAPVMWGEGSSRASGYNPVYERMLNVAFLFDAHDPGALDGSPTSWDFAGGTSSTYLGSTRADGSSDDHGALYFSALNHESTVTFSNTWEIDKQIFGDVKLSRLESDDYEPYPSPTSAYASAVSDAVAAAQGELETTGGGAGIAFYIAASGFGVTGMGDMGLVGSSDMSWSVQRVRIVRGASGWTKDRDVMLGGGSSMFGYHEVPGTTLGAIQGAGRTNGIMIPYSVLRAPWTELVVGDVPDDTSTWSQKWRDVDYVMGQMVLDEDSYMKVYTQVELDLVFEVWNATAGRWCGVKTYKIPIPTHGGTGVNNWWAAKRLMYEMSANVISLEDMTDNSYVTAAGVSKRIMNMSQLGNAFTTSAVARAFLMHGRDEWHGSGTDPDGAGYRRGGTSGLTRMLHYGSWESGGGVTDRLKLLMWSPLGHTAHEGDYALEAWKYGGNTVILNYEMFENSMSHAGFNSSVGQIGSYRPYQYNELMAIASSYGDTDTTGQLDYAAAQGWKWAFDYSTTMSPWL